MKGSGMKGWVDKKIMKEGGSAFLTSLPEALFHVTRRKTVASNFCTVPTPTDSTHDSELIQKRSEEFQ